MTSLLTGSSQYCVKNSSYPASILYCPFLHVHVCETTWSRCCTIYRYKYRLEHLTTKVRGVLKVLVASESGKTTNKVVVSLRDSDSGFGERLTPGAATQCHTWATSSELRARVFLHRAASSWCSSSLRLWFGRHGFGECV